MPYSNFKRDRKNGGEQWTTKRGVKWRTERRCNGIIIKRNGKVIDDGYDSHKAAQARVRTLHYTHYNR